MYKKKDPAWFSSNTHLGSAVSDGLALSTLAKAKYTLYLRDSSLTLHMDFNKVFRHRYHDMQRSYSKVVHPAALLSPLYAQPT